MKPCSLAGERYELLLTLIKNSIFLSTGGGEGSQGSSAWLLQIKMLFGNVRTRKTEKEREDWDAVRGRWEGLSL